MNGTGNVLAGIVSAHADRRPMFFLLLDPDKALMLALPSLIADADAAGVDAYLIGGSLVTLQQMNEVLEEVKRCSTRPAIIFPGGVHQMSGKADALLFLSIISGRNADHLIGQHVLAAPAIKQLGLEAISTGYMMIESDRVSSAEFMSNTRPIPRNKPDVAVAHAMAAELLGMKLIYMEAGSGAGLQVPCEMVHAVSHAVSLPVIVGGGIRSPEDAAALVDAGASIIVIGNHFEEEEHRKQLGAFARAIHGNGPDQARCL